MKPQKQANRNFGLDHAAGKGDKSRVTNIQSFRRNYDEINWHRTEDNEREFVKSAKLAGKIFHAHKDGDAKFSFHGLTWKP